MLFNATINTPNDLALLCNDWCWQEVVDLSQNRGKSWFERGAASKLTWIHRDKMTNDILFQSFCGREPWRFLPNGASTYVRSGANSCTTLERVKRARKKTESAQTHGSTITSADVEIKKIVFAQRVAPPPRVAELSPTTMLPSTVTHNKTFTFNLLPCSLRQPATLTFHSCSQLQQARMAPNKAHFKEEQLLGRESVREQLTQIAPPVSARVPATKLNSSGRSKTAKRDVWKVKKKKKKKLEMQERIHRSRSSNCSMLFRSMTTRRNVNETKLADSWTRLSAGWQAGMATKKRCCCRRIPAPTRAATHLSPSKPLTQRRGVGTSHLLSSALSSGRADSNDQRANRSMRNPGIHLQIRKRE